MTVDLFLTGLLQGLILVIIAYAVMIPFRLLNFPDLTSEGAYPLGGAICACCLASGFAPLVAILISILSAGIMGVGTSLIHLRFKVNTLLCGIILSTMAYSINLRIMGKPNIGLFETTTLFNQTSITDNILILVGILILFITPITLFLRTDFGLRMRAVGLNPDFAMRHDISIHHYTIFGLFIGGALAGLAGSLIVQLQSYMDIGMGIGIVIHGLAALMIGEAIVGNHTINRQLIAPLLGAIVYQQIQGLALSLGLAPSDLKLFTGCIVLFVIAIRKNIK